jgi:hypothetical protein
MIYLTKDFKIVESGYGNPDPPSSADVFHRFLKIRCDLQDLITIDDPTKFKLLYINSDKKCIFTYDAIVYYVWFEYGPDSTVTFHIKPLDFLTPEGTAINRFSAVYSTTNEGYMSFVSEDKMRAWFMPSDWSWIIYEPVGQLIEAKIPDTYGAIRGVRYFGRDHNAYTYLVLCWTESGIYHGVVDTNGMLVPNVVNLIKIPTTKLMPISDIHVGWILSNSSLEGTRYNRFEENMGAGYWLNDIYFIDELGDLNRFTIGPQYTSAIGVPNIWTNVISYPVENLNLTKGGIGDDKFQTMIYDSLYADCLVFIGKKRIYRSSAITPIDMKIAVSGGGLTDAIRGEIVLDPWSFRQKMAIDDYALRLHAYKEPISLVLAPPTFYKSDPVNQPARVNFTIGGIDWGSVESASLIIADARVFDVPQPDGGGGKS